MSAPATVRADSADSSACACQTSGSPKEGKKPEATLGQIVRLAGEDFRAEHAQPLHAYRVLSAIGLCRTAALGGHRYECRSCGGQHQSPHSCRDRHCPQCQGKEAADWMDKQRQALVPAGYFHLVFTLPHELNPLVRFNQSALYNLLFRAVSETLLTFGRKELGGQIGMTAVLHTWSQTLLDHYHLHVIVPAGALCDNDEQWKPSHPRYLFSVRALSEVYRGKFLSGLDRLFANNKLTLPDPALAQKERFQELLRKAAGKKWNVYAKRPFAGPEEVLRYLSRYTHRAAISNTRILEVDAETRTVLFSWRDYADSNRKKTMRLDFNEFLRRFCLHILPERFVRIRHYGFLSNNSRSGKVPLIRELLGGPSPLSEPTDKKIGTDASEETPALKCPHCGSSDVRLVAVIKRSKRSTITLPETQIHPRAPP